MTIYTLSTHATHTVSGANVATATSASLGSGLGGLISSTMGPVGTILGAAIGAGLGTAAGENIRDIGNGLVKATEVIGANMHRNMPGGGMPIAFQ